MSEFKIHHHTAELLKLLRISEGPGPEVYAEIFTKDLTPYVTTQVSSHTAKRKIAEASPSPEDFLKKYDELKSKNIRELDSLVYLVSCITQEKQVVRFLERNEKERARIRDNALSGKRMEAPKTPLGKEIEAITESIPKSTIMTQQEVQELKNKLANITTSTTQNSTDDLIKALREKRNTKTTSSGLPILPQWTMERPFLTQDFVDTYRPNYNEPVAVGTMPLKMQEVSVIEDLLFLFMGVEGRYVTLKDSVEIKRPRQFTVDRSLGEFVIILSELDFFTDN